MAGSLRKKLDKERTWLKNEGFSSKEIDRLLTPLEEEIFCKICGTSFFVEAERKGIRPMYCSPPCRQKAYHARRP